MLYPQLQRIVRIQALNQFKLDSKDRRQLLDIIASVFHATEAHVDHNPHNVTPDDIDDDRIFCAYGWALSGDQLNNAAPLKLVAIAQRMIALAIGELEWRPSEAAERARRVPHALR